MAANTTPIFPLTPVVSWGTLTTANNVYDGTGTQVTLITGAANGTRLDGAKIKALGTNVATVLRLFINNGSANTIASNNSLYSEYTIPATTANAAASLTETMNINLNGLILPSGYKLNASIGTTIAAGITVTILGGNY